MYFGLGARPTTATDRGAGGAIFITAWAPYATDANPDKQAKTKRALNGLIAIVFLSMS
jgi:hypothetical protein